MNNENSCSAIYTYTSGNVLQCVKPKDHPGQHANCGITWEENTKILVKVEHFIISGDITGSCHLWTEFTTPDGRKFGRRDYQLHELSLEEKYTSPISGEEK
jgi:hypothetical protein